MRTRSTCALMATIVMSVGVLAQSGFSPSAAVKSQMGKLAAAVAKKDAAAIANVYAAEAEAQPAGGEAIRGRAAIEKMWQGLLERGAAAFETTTNDADFANGTITEKGTFLVKKADGTVFSRGTYQNVWKQEAGTWKIHRNTWVDAPK